MLIEEREQIAVRDPRTGASDATITPPTPEELDALCARLRASQPAWSEAGVEHRAAVMRRWADAIEARAQLIGDAEEADTGRRRVAHEVPMMVAASVRGWCDAAPSIVERARLRGTSSTSDAVTFDTEFDPYPLLGVISPWNHPFLLSTLDAIPALLAGTALIVKPSEIAPRFVGPVMDTITEIPELAEVFAYIVGAGEIGQALIARVDVVCFTGSVPTGRRVAVACAERFIPAFLELGGKDAAIVTATADIEQAAAAVLKGAVHNTGQLCFSIERVYVDEQIHDAFVESLVRRARALQPNFPDTGHGHLGPFILGRQAAIVDEHLADAVARGAEVRCGGPSQELGGGRYMDATVVTGVDHEMAIMRDETFGPVIPVMGYADVEQAIELANDNSFGLSGAVIAGSEEEAREIAHHLHAGAISLQDTSMTINIMRDVEKTSYGLSGLGGSRMGPNGLLRFLRRKALITRHGPVLDMEALREDAAAGA
jgi:succinate-semialdehyde dehydrogenase/glutarate-semialdehyde dehydrogenase